MAGEQQGGAETYVKLPDGSYGKYPAGMSEADITASIQKNYPTPNAGNGAAKPPSVGPLDSTPKPPSTWQKMKDAGTDLAKGFGEGVLQDVGTVSRGLNKLPMVGEDLAPSQGVSALRQLATPANTMQKIGAAGEQAAELFAPTGEAGLAAKIAAGVGKGALSTATHEAGTTQGASLPDVVTSGVVGGIAPAAGEGLKGFVASKMGRGIINESLGANARDVTYGNPAKALLDEGIATPFTGDIEKYKDALRTGMNPADAAKAAGGRFAAVSGKINEIAPQLDWHLANSTAKISVRDAIEKPIIDAGKSIIDNRAMTAAEKNTALERLRELRSSLTSGMEDKITPQQANEIKRQIGDRVNWGGNTAVGDEVKPAYKAIYASLKNQVNNAVPEAAQLNERMTNLMAAQKDLHKLATQEEVGAGRGMAGGALGRNLVGRIESMAGRLTPMGSAAAPSIEAAIRSGIGLTQMGH